MTTNSFSVISEQFTQNSSLRQRAGAIFNEVRGHATFGQFKRLALAWLGKLGKGGLPSLTNRLAGKTVCGQQPEGLRTVEIEHIIGTESRAEGFDSHFNPLSDRMRERWVGIAALCLRDAGLPAVDLIQVGEEYFVRDGHHRISVARALGWAYIDARVTRLELR